MKPQTKAEKAKATIATVRALYPNPCRRPDKDGGYCVGSALVRYAESEVQEDDWDDAEIANALYALNPDLEDIDGWACEIVECNDDGAGPEAA